MPHLRDPSRAEAAAQEPGPMPGLTLPGDTRFLLGSARDGWTDGRRRSWSRAGIPAVHLVASYRHAQCSAVRPLAPPPHGRPAPTTSPPAAALPGGSASIDPWPPGWWVPLLPLVAVVTAPGFAWQRPGPAELPAHRRPDSQDWRLWALALQVQSKAGLGDEGAGGCMLGPCSTHTHRHTLHRALQPPSTHTSPLPRGAGAAPWALLGQWGGCWRVDHPVMDSLCPGTKLPPPGLSHWAGSSPP